jgi:hypothetical protein
MKLFFRLTLKLNQHEKIPITDQLLMGYSNLCARERDKFAERSDVLQAKVDELQALVKKLTEEINSKNV